MSLSSPWLFSIMEQIGIKISLITGAVLYLISSFLISRYFDEWLRWHYGIYHIVLWAQTLFSMAIGVAFYYFGKRGKLLSNKLCGRNCLIILIIIIAFIIGRIIKRKHHGELFFLFFKSINIFFQFFIFLINYLYVYI